MCGRFTLTTPLEALRHLFDFAESPNLRPRYNIAPTQSVPVVRAGEGQGQNQRSLVTMRWGLVPSWAKDIKIASRMINARGETVAEKPSFRKAFRARRCLVPADGYYEWQKEDGKRQPYRVTRKDGGPMAFAGLWERWTAKGESGGSNPVSVGDLVETFTIVTTVASESVRGLHHRMPVVIEPDDFEVWLAASGEELGPLQDLLRPSANSFAITRVSPHVNAVRNDDPQCIVPEEARAADPAPGELPL
jgi:putative SOS response-associated peptidase YedK